MCVLEFDRCNFCNWLCKQTRAALGMIEAGAAGGRQCPRAAAAAPAHRRRGPCTSLSSCTAAPERRGTFAPSTFIVLCSRVPTLPALPVRALLVPRPPRWALPLPPRRSGCWGTRSKADPGTWRHAQRCPCLLPSPLPPAAAKPPLRAPPPLHVQTNAQQTLRQRTAPRSRSQPASIAAMAAKQAVQKVLIVGGVAGGASCAARLRRLSEAVQVTIFEKGPCEWLLLLAQASRSVYDGWRSGRLDEPCAASLHAAVIMLPARPLLLRCADVSFANCGLPYHVGGVIPVRAALPRPHAVQLACVHSSAGCRHCSQRLHCLQGDNLNAALWPHTSSCSTLLLICSRAAAARRRRAACWWPLPPSSTTGSMSRSRRTQRWWPLTGRHAPSLRAGRAARSGMSELCKQQCLWQWCLWLSCWAGTPLASWPPGLLLCFCSTCLLLGCPAAAPPNQA